MTINEVQICIPLSCSSKMTSKWKTESDNKHLMLQSCRNTPKHPDTIRDKWDGDITVSEN